MIKNDQLECIIFYFFYIRLMLITYKIQEDIYVPSQEYTHNINRAVKEMIFKKYLYKITKHGVCVRIKSIEILDNVILRKDADLLVKIQLELVLISLEDNEYFEGQVIDFSEEEGIIVSFLGILEGKIPPKNLHPGSLFDKHWMFPSSSSKVYEWRIGAKIRFKISKTDWSSPGKRMADLISIRCNQEGLGPISWWI